MSDAIVQRQNSQRIEQWLFAILRFAISLEQNDRASALAVAAEIDRRGLVTTDSGFTFFVRTSVKLCDAIVKKSEPEAIATLRTHLRAIEHLPLRRAFEAALDLEPVSSKRRNPLTRSRDYLWKGLPARIVSGTPALQTNSADSE
jgi:hypothetical protein